jgi:hypothetical protein
MTDYYPCPSCEREDTTQTEHRVARIYMHPGAVGHLQCAEHWIDVCGQTVPDDNHTVAFVLEQTADHKESVMPENCKTHPLSVLETMDAPSGRAPTGGDAEPTRDEVLDALFALYVSINSEAVKWAAELLRRAGRLK